MARLFAFVLTSSRDNFYASKKCFRRKGSDQKKKYVRRGCFYFPRNIYLESASLPPPRGLSISPGRVVPPAITIFSGQKCHLSLRRARARSPASRRPHARREMEIKTGTQYLKGKWGAIWGGDFRLRWRRSNFALCDVCAMPGKRERFPHASGRGRFCFSVTETIPVWCWERKREREKKKADGHKTNRRNVISPSRWTHKKSQERETGATWLSCPTTASVFFSPFSDISSDIFCARETPC